MSPVHVIFSHKTVDVELSSEVLADDNPQKQNRPADTLA